MPFAVKKSDNSFAGFSTNPQPTISPVPFHSGFIAPFGHSNLCVFPEIQQ
jgi:hypothetical protein